MFQATNFRFLTWTSGRSLFGFSALLLGQALVHHGIFSPAEEEDGTSMPSILMNMDRIRELEIRIEKLKNKLEDIDGKLDRIQLIISSPKGRPSKLGLAAVLLVWSVYLFGAAIAVAISWSLRHSVSQAVIDGMGSWLYVTYHLLFPLKTS
jgi:hypothetical protein